MPRKKDSLNRAIGEAHRRYTRMINFREGWRGHLWQGRFVRKGVAAIKESVYKYEIG